jgi:hypothetical protein
MHVLSPDQLSAVIGGKSVTQSSDGSVTHAQTDTESCRDMIERAANNKYPDNRWFFQKWFGAKDENADARADWIKNTLPGSCGTPS